MGRKGAKTKGKSKMAVDFKRVKSKVGKQVKPAASVTDTSFTAKAISLHEQNLGLDKSAAAADEGLTKRGQSLAELLAQSAHYSEKVRAAALAGIGELAAARPAALRRHAARVLPVLAQRAADDASVVRAALKQLLAEHVLPALEEDAAAPFVPLMLAHAAAAATAQRRAVRIDGLGIVAMLLGAYPSTAARARRADATASGGAEASTAAAGSWGDGAAAELLQQTGERLTTSSQSGGAASAARPAEVLGFLDAAVALLRAAGAGGGSSAGVDDAGVIDGRGRSATGGTVGGSAHESQNSWTWGTVPSANALGPHFRRARRAGTASGADGAGAGAGGGSVLPPQLAALCPAALKLYSEYIPAAGPGAGSVRTDQQALRVARAALGCARLAGSGDPAALGDAAERCSKHFPLAKAAARATAGGRGGAGAEASGGKTEKAADEVHSLLRALDHASAEMLCAAAAAESAAAGGAPCVQRWVSTLTEYLVGALREAKGDRSAGGAAALSRALACAEVASGALPGEQRAALVGAAAEVQSKCGAAAATTLPLVQFLVAAAAREATAAPAALPQWLGGAPRMLWKLGAKNARATAVLLRALHERAARARSDTPAAEALAEMRPALAPLFATRLAAETEGSGDAGPSGGSRVVMGAFVSLPADTQELALDFLWMIEGGDLPPPLLRGLGIVAAREELSDGVRERIGALVAARGGGEAVSAGFAEALRRAGRGVPAALAEAHARVSELAAK